MHISSLDRARRSSSSVSGPNRATNMRCLIGIEMFIISATFPGDTVADAIDDGLRLLAIVETDRLVFPQARKIRRYADHHSLGRLLASTAARTAVRRSRMRGFGSAILVAPGRSLILP